MDDTHRKKTIRRLQIVEGHVRGIQRMLDEDQYCIDVIKQINAVQAALNRVSQTILEEHLQTCLTTAVRGDNKKERERVLREIVDVFESKGR
jgi:DNA-binding FrmR family transcriptional regulator